MSPALASVHICTFKAQHPKDSHAPAYVRKSLAWWTKQHNLVAGVPFHRPQPSHQITDTSLIVWGAHMNGGKVQGRWSDSERLLHINLLELRAIFLACKHFCTHIMGTVVRVLTDNVAAMYYTNRQGGARSRYLCAEAVCLWNFCIQNNITITESYLPGSDNTIADSLSTIPAGSRVGNMYGHPSSNFLQMGNTSYRSICHSIQQEMLFFLLQGRNWEGITGGCTLNQLEGIATLCIPSNSTHTQNIGEN